jgi:hypothetical protein
MSENSITILSQHLIAHLEQLAMLREYRKVIEDPYVIAALNFVIEDTHEAIARVSSRIRQLGAVSPSYIANEATDKLLFQSRSRRNLQDQILFVHHGLIHQVQWYHANVKNLINDPDSQAILVALAEQARLRLNRWETMMKEMKVPIGK